MYFAIFTLPTLMQKNNISVTVQTVKFYGKTTLGKKRGRKKINNTAESLSSQSAGKPLFFFSLKTIVNFTRHREKENRARFSFTASRIVCCTSRESIFRSDLCFRSKCFRVASFSNAILRIEK